MNKTKKYNCYWHEAKEIMISSFDNRIDNNVDNSYILCTVYGKSIDTISCMIDRSMFILQLKKLDTRDIYSQVYVCNKERYIIKDIQMDSIHGRIMHIDFYKITESNSFKHYVNIKLKNKSLCEGFSGQNVFKIKSPMIMVKVSPKDIIPSILEIDVQPMYKNAVIYPSSLDTNSYKFINQEHILSLSKR